MMSAIFILFAFAFLSPPPVVSFSFVAARSYGGGCMNKNVEFNGMVNGNWHDSRGRRLF